MKVVTMYGNYNLNPIPNIQFPQSYHTTPHHGEISCTNSPPNCPAVRRVGRLACRQGLSGSPAMCSRFLAPAPACWAPKGAWSVFPVEGISPCGQKSTNQLILNGQEGVFWWRQTWTCFLPPTFFLSVLFHLGKSCYQATSSWQVSVQLWVKVKGSHCRSK